MGLRRRGQGKLIIQRFLRMQRRIRIYAISKMGNKLEKVLIRWEWMRRIMEKLQQGIQKGLTVTSNDDLVRESRPLEVFYVFACAHIYIMPVLVRVYEPPLYTYFCLVNAPDYL